jgi:hypothetical protein
VVLVVTSLAAWNPLRLMYLEPLSTGYPVLPVAIVSIIGVAWVRASRPPSRRRTALLVLMSAASAVLFAGYALTWGLVHLDNPVDQVTSRVRSPDGRYELVTVYRHSNLRELGQTYTVFLRDRQGILSRKSLVFRGDGDGSRIGPVSARFTGPRAVEVTAVDGTFGSTFTPDLLKVSPVHRITEEFDDG